MFSNTKMQDAYDEIVMCIDNIKKSPNQRYLKDLQVALNTMFPDSECKGVLWSPNPDKLFFGIFTMPEIPADDVIRVITKDDVRYRVKEYLVELDGKMFNGFLNLTRFEIAAMLIHDVGMLVNTAVPCEEVVKSIDRYLIDNHEVLKLSDLVHYKEILSYGFRDALRKCTSLFEIGKYKRHEDTMADFFETMEGNNYSKDIVSGMNKIDKMGYNFNKEVNTWFVGLSWVLRIYKNVLGYRISAIKTLERMQELTPSQIEEKELNNFARRIARIDDDMLLESMTGAPMEDPLLESIRDDFRVMKNPVANSNAVDSMDFLKNDLVGIALKQEHLNANEPDAVPDLLRSINNRMMMIQDYAEGNETNQQAFKQWNKMFQELDRRRNQIRRLKFYPVKKRMVNTYKAQNDQ